MKPQPCCDPGVASVLPPLDSLLELFDGEWRELDRTLRILHAQCSESVRRLGRAVAARDRPESLAQAVFFFESAAALGLAGLSCLLHEINVELRGAVEWPTIMDRMHEVAACVFRLQREIQRLILAGPDASPKAVPQSSGETPEPAPAPLVPPHDCCVGI